ncbi:MAG TPA: diaminobutyrate--2-oxoglutarate transaminase [Kofleriaceae bacterium]|jgi:diaminobutyrate-2-oxoglutarate transaminase|nr:diaminobutyrate--2-oxoglutarate transaminase [Kofleriaceae bacterium]
MINTIERLESEVRTYCRSFPTVFKSARGAWMKDVHGREYIDFFAGAGALNYGHNHPVLKQALLEYVARDGITHSLDLATQAKVEFLEALDRRVLKPRGLPYRVMFPGPTGTNAVEAALKLARKLTGRTQVVAFTNAFHGMSLGSLAVTGNATKRGAAGVPLAHVIRAPYCNYIGDADSLGYLETLFADHSSGIDAPAAILVEPIQAEGGVNVATGNWLRKLAALARAVGAPLIVDDIQVGCGRTGPFFSFEEAGIEPDIVCLSKSLSGYGLPLAVTMFREELDVWSPGEHNGTFRGHNPAFVTGRAALDLFWADSALSHAVEEKSTLVRTHLARIAEACNGTVRGRGLILGVACTDPSLAKRISRCAFDEGLIVETAGAEDQVLKLLPPLTIETDVLVEGLTRLERATKKALGSVDADDQFGTVNAVAS